MKKALIVGVLSFLGLTLFSQDGCAQDRARDRRVRGLPSLYGVGEIVLDHPTFVNAEASEECALSERLIDETLLDAFSGTDVPAIPVINVRPPRSDVARIQLYTDISTYASPNLHCVSLISMSAESTASLMIPPVSPPRVVQILYWRKSFNASSSLSLHAQQVVSTIRAMAANFAETYVDAQPAGTFKKK